MSVCAMCSKKTQTTNQMKKLFLLLVAFNGLLELVSCQEEPGPTEHTSKSIPAPTTVNAQIDGEKVYVSWSEVTTAESYEVYHAVEGSEYALIGSTKATQYVHANPVKGVNKYKIKARKGTGVSELSSATATVTFGPFVDQTITAGGVTFKMIAVEGGTFTMGATAEQGSDAYDNEKPAHSVTLSDYYIGQTEVTQALWKAVMGSNPSYFSGDNLPVERLPNNLRSFITYLNQMTGKKFRLPTEAEWEYAARGGKKSKGYKYAGSNTISNVAWYSGNSGSKTHEVGTKQPNELGIYDMSGNVCEWCQGEYDSYYRGGSWFNDAGDCRVSFRHIGIYPTDAGNRFGLRLALPK